MTNLSTMQNQNDLKLAYHYTKPNAEKMDFPQIIFLSGFKSDMNGTKATFIEEFCKNNGYGFLRFDYSGHGQSGGDFDDLTLSDWISDSDQMINYLFPEDKKLLIVGSSMGAWIGLKLICELHTHRDMAFLGLGSAPDFTARLMPERFTDTAQKSLKEKGYMDIYNSFIPDAPAEKLTQSFLDDGDGNSLLHKDIPFDGIMRLIHGMQDEDVPYEHCLEIARKTTTDQLDITLIKDGEHRLSRPSDLLKIIMTISEIIELMQIPSLSERAL